MPLTFRQRVDTSALPILVVVAALFLPFCNKALHIDDNGFFQMSTPLTWNPLAPLSPGVYESTHSVFFPYFYKILFPLTGANEILLHVVFLIFPVISLLSLRSLYRTLFQPESGQELTLVLVFCSLPAFLVNAQNLMADVPTLAFILLALAAYTRSFDEHLARSSYLGGISLCIAIFISYQAATFIVVVLLYALGKKALRPHLIISLAIGPTLLLIWLLCVYQAHGIFPFIKGLAASPEAPASGSAIASVVADGFPLAAIKGKFFFVLAMTGASMLPVLLAWPFVNRIRLTAGCLLLGLLPAGFAVLSLTVDGYEPASRALLSFFVCAGIVTIALAARFVIADLRNSAFRGRGVLLLSWIGIVLCYNVFLLPFGSARYLLPALPAVMMIIFSRVHLALPAHRSVTAGLVGLSLLLGLSCALADYRHADSYRQMAAEVKISRSNSSQPFDVWYVGEWGMAYYMDRAGARFLPPNSSEPKRGDLIILPEIARRTAPSLQVQQRARPYATREFISAWPMRIFHLESKSGFYSHLAGLLPMNLSRAPDEKFTILEVVK